MSSTTIVADAGEQHRSPANIARRRAELLHREAGIRELLRGERGDPVLERWRHRQLASLLRDLNQLDRIEAELGVAR